MIVSAVFPPEPIVSATISCDLASLLCNEKEVVVISPKPTRPFGFELRTVSSNYSFKHIILNSYTCPKSRFLGRFYESYSFGKHCYNYIKKNKDNINLIYANTWPLIAQYYTVKAARRFGIPMVLHIQDIYPESLLNKISFGKNLLSFFLLPLDRYIMRNSAKIVAISAGMKDHLMRTRGICSDKIVVISNWIDEEKLLLMNKCRNQTPKNGDFTFMYLGNIGPVAGVDLLIEAFIKANVNNSRLLIAGSGSLKKSLEKLIALKEIDNIEFLAVPDGKVGEILDMADVLLLPVKKGAAWSSIPSKLISYMLSSKPIIACVDNGSDTALAIKHAGNGWIIYPGDADALANAMRDVRLIEKEQLKIIGSPGYNYALTHFSKKMNLTKLIEVISGAVKE